MYRFKGGTGDMTTKIHGKYYSMASSSVDFRLIGNRWVSVAKIWNSLKFEDKTLIFHGQLDKLMGTMRSGLIVEHPEWLAMLPPAFDIENWEVEPEPDLKNFRRLWDMSRDIHILTTRKAIRFGLLFLAVNTGRYD